MWDEGPAETPVDRDRRAIAEAFQAEVPEGHIYLVLVIWL